MAASADFFLAILAILFPPLAVWIKTGLCSCASLVNIILCVLGYLPGLLHAWYIIAQNPEESYVDYEYERIPVHVESQTHQPAQHGDRVIYVVQSGVYTGQGGNAQASNGAWSGAMPGGNVPRGGYGTVNASSRPEHGTEGSSALPPPPAYEAVPGDNKIQRS